MGLMTNSTLQKIVNMNTIQNKTQREKKDWKYNEKVIRKLWENTT